MARSPTSLKDGTEIAMPRIECRNCRGRGYHVINVMTGKTTTCDLCKGSKWMPESAKNDLRTREPSRGTPTGGG